MTDRKKELPVLAPLPAAALAVGVVVAAALAGRRASPTRDHPATRHWYRKLDKPGFTPPAPAYGLAWGGIEAALAFGGYTLLRSPPSAARNAALATWGLNQIGVGGWNSVFFGNRAPGWGTIASAALGGVGVSHVASAAKVSRSAAMAGIPFVAWIGFATLLAEEIWRKNKDAPTA